MADKIVIIDSIEDDQYQGKAYKLIIDKQGEAHKIGQLLKDKWYMLKPDEAIRLKMSTFTKEGKNIAYVKDIEVVQNIFEREAALKVAQSKNPRDTSIEAQVAVKAVVDLEVSGRDIPDDIHEMCLSWIRKALEGGLK